MKYLMISAIITSAMLLTASTQLTASKVIYLDDQFPGSSIKFNSQLKQSISKAGFKVEGVSGLELAGKLAAQTGSGNILVLPNAVYFPLNAKENLDAFLKKGNHLFAVSGPTLSKIAINVNGIWLTEEDAKIALSTEQGNSIFDFNGSDISKWDRNAGLQESPIDIRIEPSGQTGIPDALHVKIEKLSNWDLLLGKNIPVTFPEGTSATAFWAKGGPDTPELVFEWREKDNCRWMSSVKLSTEWKRYILLPDDFKFWSDGSPVVRGGEKDQFNPANASHFSFGIADGISKQKKGIAHEFWIADVRGIRDSSSGYDFSQPILESLSPQYKTFTSEMNRVKDIGTGKSLPANTTIVSPMMRALGLGMDSLRKWRFIPVMQGYDKSGEKRGIAAHLFLNNTGDYAGSVFGYAGFNQDYLERNGFQVIPTIIRMMKRIDSGLFIANGGTDHFAYTEGEKPKYGAYIVNLTEKPVTVQYEVIITDRKSPYRFRNKTTVIPARNMASPEVLSGTYNPDIKPGEYLVKTRLIRDAKVVDEIDHPFRVIRFAPIDEKQIVITKGNDFYLDGKKWYPIGINYWPRSSNGCENGEDSLFWLSPERYDPVLVEEDLAIIEKLKMNVVSITYYNEAQSRPLMDFLQRAKKHNIKVHIWLPGLHPLSHDFELANKMITSAHLPESTAFFSYDLGWEVHTGYYDARKKFDKDWQKWVIDRYGSIDSAVKDWGYKPEIIDGVLTGPKDDQLSNDGEWRIFVAAYRRFKDDFISMNYRLVRDDIKSLDKYHLMGSRSGWAGLGAMWAVPAFPFDIFSGAKHLDYMSPEGYAVYGDRTKFLEGGFDNAYCTFSSAGKPICWVEYGAGAVGINPLEFKDYTPELLEEQRTYYQNMMRMTFETFANGSMGWWFPGGIRLGENSDLGLVRANGTVRPAAYEITKAVDWFHRDTEIPRPDTFITLDRDKYVTGYAGVRAENVRTYVDAFLSGKKPGVRTEGTGTTSVDTPLIAVGNKPYNGTNPPKYLNSEFNSMKVNGMDVKDGSVVSVKRGEPVMIDASIGNTAEASWVAPRSGEDGSVYLLIQSGGNALMAPIAQDTPFLSDVSIQGYRLSDGLQEETAFTFKMTALNRMGFGEVFRITLKPE
ncbi:MAG: hypothetical protein ACYC0V_12780 [Armatimonadota bacterium]